LGNQRLGHEEHSLLVGSTQLGQSRIFVNTMATIVDNIKRQEIKKMNPFMDIIFTK
jgi:hypothetical protein